ncbi:MAG TPA: hypothetical protein VF057_01790, partial [Thermoanaerobaculia bacterium]
RVRANALASACAGASGVITVTNVENGDTDLFGDATNELPFTYIPITPQITSIIDDIVTVGDTSDIQPGEIVQVTVDDPGVGPLGSANIRFQVLGNTIIPSPSTITDPITPQPFDFAMPLTGFNFPAIACTIGGAPGVQLGPVQVPITFVNTTTGCTDTASVVVLPPTPNDCVVPPQAAVAPGPGSCASPAAPQPIGGGSVSAGQITFTNNAPVGAQDLTVRLVGITGANAADFQITPSNGTAADGGGTAVFNVTFDPVTAGQKTATATFSTNDPNNPTMTVCLSGEGIP